jgi:hypothetical protein
MPDETVDIRYADGFVVRHAIACPIFTGDALDLMSERHDRGGCSEGRQRQEVVVPVLVGVGAQILDAVLLEHANFRLA